MWLQCDQIREAQTWTSPSWVFFLSKISTALSAIFEIYKPVFFYIKQYSNVQLCNTLLRQNIGKFFYLLSPRICGKVKYGYSSFLDLIYCLTVLRETKGSKGKQQAMRGQFDWFFSVTYHKRSNRYTRPVAHTGKTGIQKHLSCQHFWISPDFWKAYLESFEILGLGEERREQQPTNQNKQTNKTTTTRSSAVLYRTILEGPSQSADCRKN